MPLSFFRASVRYSLSNLVAEKVTRSGRLVCAHVSVCKRGNSFLGVWTKSWCRSLRFQLSYFKIRGVFFEMLQDEQKVIILHSLICRVLILLLLLLLLRHASDLRNCTSYFGAYMWVWYCRPPIGAHFHPTPQPPPVPQ